MKKSSNKEKKDCPRSFLISISGNQVYSYEDNVDTVSFVTSCDFSKKNGKFYISYEEYSYNVSSRSKGFSQLEVSDNEVILRRVGNNATVLIFQKKTRHQCCYNTEYGVLTLGIYTNNISSSLTENGGILKVNYSIDANLNFKCYNEFSVKVWEVKKDVAIAS